MQPTDTTPQGVPIFDVRPQSLRLRKASEAVIDAVSSVRSTGPAGRDELLRALREHAPEYLRAAAEYAAALMEMCAADVPISEREHPDARLRAAMVLLNAGEQLVQACRKIEQLVELVNADEDN